MPKMKTHRGMAKRVRQDRLRQTHARQGVQEPYPHQEEPQAQAQLPPRDRGRQGGYQGRRAPARPSLVPFVFKE